MTLGKAGVAGEGPDTFNMPSAVLLAPNGDIFVADGHTGGGAAAGNARVVKFDKSGKFVKTWGKKGMGPGEFDVPHTIALDSRGRLISLLDCLREQLHRDSGHSLRNARQPLTRSSGLSCNVAMHQFHRIGCCERETAG